MNDSPQRGALGSPLPAVDDPEGERLPPGLPPLVDAHVHLFPAELFAAVWRWFDRHGWPVRYRMPAEQLLDFLAARGVAHVVALHYAHKPGVARELNRFMAGIARRRPQVTALATVFPGEPGAAALLEEAFADGLAGVKLHNHVQCFDVDGAPAREVYAVCSAWDKPLVIHAGREPKSPAYACDPYALCGAGKLEAVIRRFPRLRVCVPHLGADEFDAYRRLIEDYDNLWLDTTMALADYLPIEGVPPLEALRAERVMFGTDFPNIPYAWDREIRRVAAMGLAPARLQRLLSKNACEFFGIENLAVNPTPEGE